MNWRAFRAAIHLRSPSYGGPFALRPAVALAKAGPVPTSPESALPPLLPKFVSEGAAVYHELRKRGTRTRLMLQFSVLDLVALAVFVSAWAGYALTVEISAHGRDSLNARMNRYREVW